MTFHIGAHKTGTTVIQRFLSSNRPQLREHRIACLRRPILDAFAKNKAERDPHNGPLAVQLANLAAQGRTDFVIASCENLIGPPFTDASDLLYPKAAERAEALRQVLAPYNVTVIVTVRPQADFMESYYLQRVNQGDYDTFQEWFAQRNVGALAWRPVIDTMTDAFGSGAVHVMDFRMLRDQGAEAYLSEFLMRSGPGPCIPIAPPEADNASLSARGLQIALAINPLLVDKDERVAARKFLQEHFSNRDFPRPVLLTDQQRAELEHRYAADYADVVAG